MMRTRKRPLLLIDARRKRGRGGVGRRFRCGIFSKPNTRDGNTAVHLHLLSIELLPPEDGPLSSHCKQFNMGNVAPVNTTAP